MPKWSDRLARACSFFEARRCQPFCVVDASAESCRTAISILPSPRGSRCRFCHSVCHKSRALCMFHRVKVCYENVGMCGQKRGNDGGSKVISIDS